MVVVVVVGVLVVGEELLEEGVDGEAGFLLLLGGGKVLEVEVGVVNVGVGSIGVGVVVHFPPAVLLADVCSLVEQVPGRHEIQGVAKLVVELNERFGLDLDSDELLENSAALEALVLPQLLQLVHLHLLIEQKAELDLALEVILEIHHVVFMLHHLPADREVIDELIQHY